MEIRNDSKTPAVILIERLATSKGEREEIMRQADDMFVKGRISQFEYNEIWAQYLVTVGG